MARSSFLSAPVLAVPALCLALVMTAVTAKAAEESFPGVKTLMSETEFRDSGLGKLTPAEVEALNRWLIRYTAGEAEVLQQTNEAVREAERDLEVAARITGDFEGWDGKTLFRLDNGQVWKQRIDGRYHYRGAANPEVRIDKNWLGFYKMTLVDEDRSIGVTRVR